VIPKNLKHKLSNIEYFSKGKRSLIYIASYRNKKVAIKIKNPDSSAKKRIQNEIKILRKLNKYGIGPKLLLFNENYMVYEFIDGPFLVNWVKNKSKKEVRKIVGQILIKCRKLDKLKINKREFNHPIKHIIISKEAKLIDFERCYSTKKPKNVTQFCQFLMSNQLPNLKVNKKELITLLKRYKEKQTETNFKLILSKILHI